MRSVGYLVDRAGKLNDIWGNRRDHPVNITLIIGSLCGRLWLLLRLAIDIHLVQVFVPLLSYRYALEITICVYVSTRKNLICFCAFSSHPYDELN